MKKLTSKEQITNSIAKFLSENKLPKTVSLVEAYNNWSMKELVIIEDKDLIQFAIEKVNEMIGLDEKLLKEAINLLNNNDLDSKGGQA